MKNRCTISEILTIKSGKRHLLCRYLLMLCISIGCLVSGCSNKEENAGSLTPLPTSPEAATSAPGKDDTGHSSGGSSGEGSGDAILPGNTDSDAEDISKAPTEEELLEQQLYAIISEMSLEEKISQMFFIRCPGEQTGAETIRTYQPAGYILFASDFEKQTPESIRQIIAGYQAEAKIPLLIAVDEEGGTVTRVSRFKAFRDEKFMSPQDVYKAGGMDAIIADTIEKSQLLASLGINMNLGPVCDISTNPKDYMYARSFGLGVQDTVEYVRTVVRTMKEQGMMSALKHFPGYGNNENTHNGIATDNRPYEQFVVADFMPFRVGIETGASAVMVSHNVVTCMDAEAPASLSPEVHRILREELGFEGVIMTDDLSMDAILLHTGNQDAAVAAVLAGNDLLVSSHYEEQMTAIAIAVEQGILTESRIEESVYRILKLKAEYIGF